MPELAWTKMFTTSFYQSCILKFLAKIHKNVCHFELQHPLTVGLKCALPQRCPKNSLQIACSSMSLHADPKACMQIHELACSSLSLHEVPWACIQFLSLSEQLTRTSQYLFNLKLNLLLTHFLRFAPWALNLKNKLKLKLSLRKERLGA